MSKYTKIVATISDARCDVDFIKQLYESGMNVVRAAKCFKQIREQGLNGQDFCGMIEHAPL